MMISALPSSISLPPDFLAKELLDETIDSVNILAVKSGEPKKPYSVRIFNRTDMSRELIERMIKWNDEIKLVESKNESMRKTSRFVTFDLRSDPATQTYYAIHPFFPRTLEFVCSFGVDLFDDEKHAICFQLARICYYVSLYRERLPIFPSRFVLNDDLFLQLTDLYPPNPIDEEAFEMGWFDETTTNDDFFIKIIQKLWNIDEEDARQKLFAYQNFQPGVPSWGEHFMSKHRNESETDGIPPVIALDINRAKLTFPLEIMCCSLSEILKIVPNLSHEMIEKRIFPIISKLMYTDSDVIQCLILLLIVEVTKRTGFSDKMSDVGHTNDRFTVQSYIESLVNSKKRSGARFVLYCILPDIISLMPAEYSKALIRVLLDKANTHEMVAFSHNFTQMMVKLNEVSLSQTQSTVKPFVCQILNQMQLTDTLLGSLISMPPSLYVVDALLTKMSKQIKSQIEMRYLISVSQHASPAILHGFRFIYAATSSLTVSSLALVFIQRLKKHIHHVDYRMLIPSKIQPDLVHVPVSPDPVDDSLLETIKDMIAFDIIGDTPPEPAAVRPKGTAKTRVSVVLGPVSDFDFTRDGQYFLAVGQSSLRVFQRSVLETSCSTAPHESIFDLNMSAEKIASIGTGAFIGGHRGNDALFKEVNIATHFTSDPIVLPDAGKVTVMEKSPERNLLMTATQSGDVFVKKDTLVKLMTINRELGEPISLSFIPNSMYYVIGTNEGNVISYDLRMQCPIRRTRPSNMPAHVCGCDSQAFWMTAGPYCAKLDVKTSSLLKYVYAPPSHVTGCCCIDDWIVTAHSDYSVYAYNQKAINMVNGILKSYQDGKKVRIVPNAVSPVHEHPINIIKTSRLTAAPITCDTSGLVVLWPTPK